MRRRLWSGEQKVFGEGVRADKLHDGGKVGGDGGGAAARVAVAGGVDGAVIFPA